MGADTIGSQPLQKFLVKAGSSFTLTKLGEKLKLNLFAEFAEVCNNYQTEGTVIVDADANRAHVRYNVWDTRIRAGVLPEFFITEKLSLSYQLGLQYFDHGTHYKVNAAGDGTESIKSGHSEFGVFASGLGISGPTYANYNISFTC